MVRPPDAPRTIKEVAAVAGVSKSTVSRVLNDTPGVSPHARERVRSAIDRIGYQPNRAARSLVTRATGSIGLVVSEAHARIFSDPFFASIVRGATEVVRPLGIHLVLMLAEDQRAREQLLEYLRHGHVDGVLFVSTHAADPLPRILVAEKLPAVLSARPVGRLAISYVDVDSVAGAGLAVGHLVERGRRRIATIAGPQDMPAGQDRLSAFRDALARHGLPSPPVAEGDFTRASGEAAARALLEAHPELDGLFVANDLMAEGALRVLQEAGRRVPGDISVVGFDDSSAALEAHPQLTTIHQPVEEMAGEMARLLLAGLREPGRSPRTVIFSPTLVARDSS
jgi:DNA-binding LacI/PurR family transcriptional regulator